MARAKIIPNIDHLLCAQQSLVISDFRAVSATLAFALVPVATPLGTTAKPPNYAGTGE